VTTPAPPATSIWAASYQALRDFYQQREQAFARAMDDRRKWEQATAQARQLAIAADAELRRRHPNRKIEPLRSAEPAPLSDAERQHLDRIPTKRTPRRSGSATWKYSSRLSPSP
jgi:hypothetical protein